MKIASAAKKYIRLVSLILTGLVFLATSGTGLALSPEQKKVFQIGARYFNVDASCSAVIVNQNQQNIFVIGDSLTVGMRDSGDLQAKLQAKGWNVRGIEATVGINVANSLPKVDNDASQIRGSGTIVVALGTNPDGDFTARVSDMITKLKQLAPTAQIYWMNAYGTSNHYDEVDGILSAQVGALGFKIMDWKAEATSNALAYPFAGDGIHLTAAGYGAKSDFLVKSVGSPAPALSGSLGGKIQLVGADNEEKIWNFLLGTGLSPEQAAGVMGNIQAESGFNPAADQGGAGGGSGYGNAFGIIQWDGGRRTALEDAARTAGVDAADLGFQLQYMYNESIARESRDYPGVNEWDGLKRQTTVADATLYWHRNAERSSDGADKIQGRVDNANAILARFQGSGTGAGATAGVSSCGPSGGAGGNTTAGANQDQDTSNLTCPDGTTDAGVEQDYGPGRTPTVKVRLCNLPTVNKVNASIAKAALTMVNAAQSAGFSLNGGSWRSYDDQARLRIQNGCPDVDTSPSSSCRVDTARPGNSLHEVGLAIDFDNMCFGSSVCPSNPAWRWLMDNAVKYGFKKSSTEAWHWSPNGN